MSAFRFEVKDYVKKRSGYAFHGEVRARFLTKAGEARYVVEADFAGFDGLYHIFSEAQLEKWDDGDTGRSELQDVR